ncbi:hypothetical protein [Natronohydrobacter thiooxidans]|uniref:hypothetical protein n=1 Tax=Natronohydrobacter thiooxidans TaxID=87172 RepID=UPI0008FF274C|nr:hypothetical protein [Natronohydrobacter thiooxidans]
MKTDRLVRPLPGNEDFAQDLAAAAQAAPALADWIAAEVERPLLIGPDSESAQWVAAIAGRI